MLIKEKDIVFKLCWFFATECEDGYFNVNRCRFTKNDFEYGEQHKQRLWDDLNERAGTNFYFWQAMSPVHLIADYVPF